MMKLLTAVLVFLCMFASAAAEENLYPTLSDPVDKAVQSLAIMSQRDEAFDEFEYNGGLLTIRGCLPVSMANGVIAALGVTDRETAAGMVKETSQLLVFPKSRGKGRVEMKFLPTLLNVKERAEQEGRFPWMAQTMGRYPGEVRLLGGSLNAESVEAHARDMDWPCMLVGRIEVYPDWTEMIRIVERLHQMGMDDACVVITHASAGTESSGAPLRSGEGGHYLTLMIHVQRFMEQGRIYVMDSLPRAIAGEESGYTKILRKPYPFSVEYTTFKKNFEAVRISPTVIRLSRTDTLSWTAADAKQKAQQFGELIVFGPCVVMIVRDE